MEFPKLYTQFAKYYDRLESQYRDYPKEVDWINGILSERDSKDIVDISCGTGNHISLLSLKSNRNFHAMDASKQMIPIAEAKIAKFNVSFVRADFLSSPYRRESFDAALCMYWSLAGLDEVLVHRLFKETCSILRKGGVLVFDVENSSGIKENLIDVPFIDAFFEDSKENVVVIRANFSTKSAPDLVDWHAYYMIESDGVSEMQNDRMDLRFYSKPQLETILRETGFKVVQVLSGPKVEYEEHGPSIYFIAEKV